MSFEKKDLIPIAIALAALGVNLGQFVAPKLATLVLGIALVLLLVFFFWRTPSKPETLIEQPTPEERQKERRVGVVRQLKALYDGSNTVMGWFIVASSQEQLDRAISELNSWKEQCIDLIKSEMSLGQAEAFINITRLNRIDLGPMMQYKNRSDFEWDKKKRYIDECFTRKEYLAKLMEQVDPM
jgi:hypothetical protein